MDYRNKRIKGIAAAATSLFLEQGYSRTQISHIAKAAGISVGSIYLDFTGKKEIMQFILKCSLEPEFANQKFERPITDELFNGVQEEILNVFNNVTDQFEKHMGSTGSYGFETLLSDTFDMMARYAVIYLFIRRNSPEFRVLSEHYDIYQKRLLSAMATYISRYMSLGTVRRMKNPEQTAMFILQTLSWWAMDMGWVSSYKEQISLETAKKMCLDNLIFAYTRNTYGNK